MRIKKLLTSIVVVFIAFVVGATTTVNAQETKWVNDETNLVSQDILDGVTFINEELFPTYEIQPQLGVEIIFDIPEEYSGIDEYRVARFNELGIGSSKHDSGILLIIALYDRKFAIETGYGVEPILRDIEAKQILDNMTDDMRKFTETGDGEHLNNALNLAIGTIAKTLERGDTGELFAEREAKLAQEEAEREETRKFMKGFMGTVLAIIVGGMGLAGVSVYKEEREEEKRKEQLKLEISKTLQEFESYYKGRLLPFEREYGFSDFKAYFMEDIHGEDVDYVKSLREDKSATINRYRVEDVESSLRNINTKNPTDYYHYFLTSIREYIDGDDRKLVSEYVNEVDKEIDSEREKAYKLQEEVKNTVNEFLDKEDNVDYLNKDEVSRTISTVVGNQMNLTEQGIKGLSVRDLPKEYILKIIEEEYHKEIVKGYILTNSEFTSSNMAYGTQDGFTHHAISRIDSIVGRGVDIRDKSVLGTILLTMLAGYIADKQAQYIREQEEQRKREERRRKEEEEERRRRRMASSSSSSSSSSSRSGGSFGSGFGGGRSGGGGASGGW